MKSIVCVLHNLYSHHFSNQLERIRLASAWRFIIRHLANLVMPIYYCITSHRKEYSLNENDSDGIVVSLTSFPKRMSRIWIVIESILHQTLKPSKIILYLSKSQYPTKESVPQKVRNLCKRGLIIRFIDDDLRSHNKYYYCMKEFPFSTIITIDDDIIYNDDIIYKLNTYHQQYKDCIIANRTKQILYKDCSPIEYNKWKNNFNSGITYNAILLGYSAVLYPPKSLHNEVFNIEAIKKTCFYADDLWLYSCARLNNTSIVQTDLGNILNIPILIKDDIKLRHSNVKQSGNDCQIKAIAKHMMANYNFNPFSENI